MEKKFRDFLAEGNFNSKEFNKIVDKGISKLWDGVNELETIASNYMKKNGQGGAVGAYIKQLKVTQLKKLIGDMEKEADKF